MNLRIAIVGLTLALTGALTTNSCLAKAPSIAQEEPESESTRAELNYAPDEWPEAPDTAAMLKRLVAGTVIVLGLCVVTLLVGRRWLRGAPARAAGGNRLRLIETVALGNRCAVHLVHAGDHQVLVGVDGTGMRTLVALPQSFEQAFAESRAPEFGANEPFEAPLTHAA